MLNVAILYICIGEYSIFWKDFYDSFEEKFLSNCHKEYYVFTDNMELYKNNEDNVHIIEQKNLGWPGNTLFRFKMFLTQKQQLLKFDYIFFLNANAVCMKEVGEEFLPHVESLLFVQHPGFYNVPNYRFPYDRNKKSSAYIPYKKGNVYVTGAINGGKSKGFLQMCEELSREIDMDYERGIIALWHDESHINKYILNRSDYKLLPPSYIYTEGKTLPFSPIILARDKNKFININKIKSIKKWNPGYKHWKNVIICMFYDIEKRILKSSHTRNGFFF